MKRFSLLVLFVLQLTVYSQDGWYSQSSGTTAHLWSVSFINVNTGWAVGASTDSGVIRKTTNGGLIWFAQFHGGAHDLKEVFFIDSNTGWASGSGNYLIKTINGGLNWADITTFSDSITSIQFLSVNTGWACTFDGFIYKSIDGGISWVQQPTNIGGLKIWRSVSIVNDSIGYIAGGHGTIGFTAAVVKTTNGGALWNFLNVPVLTNVCGVDFININTGWVVGFKGVIIRSINGGVGWSYQNSGTTIDLYSVDFADSNNGWTVGDSGIILNTRNGGIDWHTQVSGTTNNLHSIIFVNSSVGWIVGDSGIILKTTTGGEPIGIKPISSEIPSQFSLYQNYPNPFNPSTKIKFDIPTPLNPPFGKGGIKGGWCV